MKRLERPKPRKSANSAQRLPHGAHLTLEIESLSHDGRGIAKREGKTVFVAGALPGEQVRAQVDSDHSRFTEAHSVRIERVSDKRSEPLCPYYGRCGGCNLQHLAFSSQLASKQQQVLNQLQRTAQLEPAQLLRPLMSAATAYRRRARLAVKYARGRVEFGFRQQGSDKLVDVDRCAVLEPELERLLAPLGDWLRGLKSRAISHVELVAGDYCALVLLRQMHKFRDSELALLRGISRDLNVPIYLQRDKRAVLTDLDGAAVETLLNYQLPEFDLSLDFHPQDFIQVNGPVNRAMVKQAIELLNLSGSERVLDLFCGIGNFTLPLARRALSVVGVEAVESMVARARHNAERNGIGNVEFVGADLETDVSRHLWAREPFDAVLLDPPRAGAKVAMNWIEQLCAQRVVYVSCDPATLARDAKALQAIGYRLEKLGVMDMFAQTAHVESMALFVRR